MAYHSKYTGAEVDALLGKVESGEVGGKVTVDSALSTESENPVMNKVITVELNNKADKNETDTKLATLSQELGEYETGQASYMRVITDANENFLFGIKTDGSIEWGKGVPTPVKESILEEANNVRGEVQKLSESIEALQNDVLAVSPQIEALQNDVDKVNSTADELEQRYGQNENLSSYIRVVVDSEENFLFGIKVDGSIEWAKGIPTPVKEYVINTIAENTKDKVDKVDGKTLINGEFASAKTAIESLEFFSIEVDENDAIVSATRRDGTKQIPKLECDTIKVGQRIILNDVSLAQLQQDLKIEDKVKKELELVVDEMPVNSFAEDVEYYDSFKAQMPNLLFDGATSVIRISTQEQFNNVNALINTEIGNGKTHIVVSLECDGVLYFNEEHFSLTSKNYPSAENVRLTIVASHSCKIAGAGMELIASKSDSFQNGKCVFNNVGSYDHKAVILSKSKEVLAETDVRCALSEVEIVNEESKYFRLKLSADDVNKIATSIFLTSWYRIFYFTIDKIQDGYAYFYHPSAEYSEDYGWDVNQDMTLGNSYPRYQLLNCEDSDIYINDGKAYASCANDYHICLCGRFLYADGSAFKSICVQNLSFAGNYDKASLIDFDNFNKEYALVENCEFRSIKNICVNSRGVSSNVIIRNCKAEACYERLAYSENTTSNVFAIGNFVDNTNRTIRRYAGIELTGQDSYIGYNEIKNVAYIGIRTGEWYDDAEQRYSSVIVEHNKLWHTDEYAADIWKHGLMDGGPIYVGKHCNRVIIRDNLILNTSGISANRGIFLDAYAYNVAIYRNAIVNTHNDYDIESYVTETTPPYNAAPYNTNNLMYLNVITSSYKFQEHRAESTCKNGANILILTSENLLPKNDLNVKNADADYHIEKCDVWSQGIRIPVEYKKVLNELSLSAMIRNVLSFKN